LDSIGNENKYTSDSRIESIKRSLSGSKRKKAKILA